MSCLRMCCDWGMCMSCLRGNVCESMIYVGRWDIICV